MVASCCKRIPLVQFKRFIQGGRALLYMAVVAAIRHNVRDKDKMTARVALVPAVMTALALGGVPAWAHDRMRSLARPPLAQATSPPHTARRPVSGGVALASTPGNTTKTSLARGKTALAAHGSHFRRQRSAKTGPSVGRRRESPPLQVPKKTLQHKNF